MISLKRKNKLETQRNYSNLVTTSISTIFLLSLFLLLQESTYAVACYTDSWADDSQIPEDTMYYEGDTTNYEVIGAGITRVEYYEPYHDAGVITTITSPGGQQATAYDDDLGEGGWKQPFVARAEVMLLWTADDVGQFSIISEHSSSCPYTNFGSTQTNFSIGASYAAFFIRSCSGTGCWYDRTQPCNVPCPGRPSLFVVNSPNQPNSGACVWAITPRGPLGCLRFFVLKKNVTSCICFDVGWN